MMERLDPGLVALLGGMAGAVLMLLLVLLAIIGIALPMVRAVVRFVGNFDNLSAQRRGGRILVSGGLDDWREAAAVEREVTNGSPARSQVGELRPVGSSVTFEPDARRGQS